MGQSRTGGNPGQSYCSYLNVCLRHITTGTGAVGFFFQFENYEKRKVTLLTFYLKCVRADI